MNTYHRIDKLNRVIDCPMLRDRKKLLHPSVCNPFITTYDGTRSNVLLYNGEKSGHMPTWYHLHHSNSWCFFDLFQQARKPIAQSEEAFHDDSDKKNYNGSVSASVSNFFTFGLCRKRDSSIWTTTPWPPRSSGASTLVSCQLQISRR